MSFNYLMNHIKKKRVITLLAVLFFSILSFTTKAEALSLSPVRFELSADPGTVIKDEMVLLNETDTTETFYASFSNFEAQGESGSPSFMEPTEGLGTWITTQDSITIQGGQSQIVPFEITVPSNAPAGGNFAAIFWSTSPPVEGSDSVIIGAKTGILVLLSVNGDVKVAGGINDFDTIGGKHYFESLPIDFIYHFHNEGGDRIKPDGNIIIKNMLGLTTLIPANKVEGNVLPNQTRKFEVLWQGKGSHSVSEAQAISGFFNKARYEWQNFAIGRYKATLSLIYGTATEPVTKSTVLWVFPWHFLLIFIIVLLLVLFILRKLVRTYNHWIIKQVEKRMEAQAAKDATISQKTPNDMGPRI
jgi:hypothetical protein